LRVCLTMVCLCGILIDILKPGIDGRASDRACGSARVEIHSIESLTLTSKQFLTCAKVGALAHLGGELRLPPGTGRVPATLLVQGLEASEPMSTAGLGRSTESVRRVLCSIASRGGHHADDHGEVATRDPLAMIVDIYRAMAPLAKHTRYLGLAARVPSLPVRPPLTCLGTATR
jgi:hypothetical protein